MLPISFQAKPMVDTQGTPAQVSTGLVISGLTRIKNGYLQKLGGCVVHSATLHGATANIVLNWISHPAGSPFLTAIGTYSGLEVSLHSVTPAFFIPPPFSATAGWTLAIWGANTSLISAYRGSTIYIWTPSFPLAASGVSVAVGGSAPAAVTGIFVAAPQQQAFAWGAYSATLGAQDSLLVAWCDVADLTVWTATATNQAGSYRLSSGSSIIAGTWFNLVGLFWTDLDLWTAQYVGFPLVYGFNRVAESCGLISRQAWGVLGNVVAWMGQNDFHAYEGGGVRVIPCTVRDFVFNTIDRTAEVHCDVNSQFWEFTWRFSRIGASGKCCAYVKWNIQENVWDVWADPVGGTPNAMWLNSWTDESANQPPFAVDYDGNLLQFEYNGNLPLTSYGGAGLNSFYRTGWFYLAEGQEQVFIERIMPGFIFTLANGFYAPQGQLTMTIYVADEIPPTDTDYPIRTYGPYTVTPETPYIIVRASGRVVSYRVDCTDPNTFYREGKHMARVAITGRGR